MSNGFIVRPAVIDDIDQLVCLNRNWLKSALVNNLQNGFLASMYSDQEFTKIISENEIIVAEDSGRIIGWYLVNTHVMNEVQNKSISAVEKLKRQLIIPPTLELHWGTSLGY